jgi:Tfp pilus assembly protein PilZ
MPERRQERRVRRRLAVKFGERDLSHSGLTLDLSRSGAFVVSPHRPALDMRIHMQLSLPLGRFVYLEATIRRHKQVAPELRAFAKGGFGTEFLLPGEFLKELIVDAENSVDVHFQTEEDLKTAYEKELRHGGVFINTDRVFPPDAAVLVIMYLHFAEKIFEFPASVMHVGRDTPQLGSQGLALLFTEPKAFQQTVKPFL